MRCHFHIQQIVSLCLPTFESFLPSILVYICSTTTIFKCDSRLLFKILYIAQHETKSERERAWMGESASTNGCTARLRIRTRGPQTMRRACPGDSVDDVDVTSTAQPSWTFGLMIKFAILCLPAAIAEDTNRKSTMRPLLGPCIHRKYHRPNQAIPRADRGTHGVWQRLHCF